MIPHAASAPNGAGWMSCIRATVSSTVAPVSAASRSSSSRLTCRGRSATTFCRARDPGRPARTSASTRARDTELRAASAPANTPASGTSSIAATIRAEGGVHNGRRISCPRGRPRRARPSRRAGGLPRPRPAGGRRASRRAAWPAGRTSPAPARVRRGRSPAGAAPRAR